jgi:hypothetical protein
MGRNKKDKLVKPSSKVKVSGTRRGVTISCKSLTREEVVLKSKLDDQEFHLIKPKTRAECKDMERPCPFIGCKYHLYLDINKNNGSIKFNFPDLEFDELDQTCALDIIEKGETTLEDIGKHMNLTRERVRQIQDNVIEKLKISGLFPEEVLDYYNIKD